MDIIHIKKHLAYLIVPFAYGTSYNQAISSLKDHHSWQQQNITSRDHIFDHISNLVLEGTRESIGQQYALTTQGRQAHGLPKKADSVYTYELKVKNDSSQKENKVVKFSIPEIQLFLFETQVGFLIYRIDYKDVLTTQDFNLFNYYLKHFAQSEGQITGKTNPLDLIFEGLKQQGYEIEDIPFRMKYGKTAEGIVKELKELKPEQPVTPYDQLNMVELQKAEQKTEVSIEIKWLSHHLLKSLQVISYFENHWKDEILLPSNAIVFNSVTLDDSFIQLNDLERQTQYLRKNLFLLRRTFKNSYKPSPDEFDLENNPEIFQAFENSYWGVSLEGITNLTYTVEDENTNTFITNGYYTNLQKNYLFLYLVSLHQRYALIRITMEASELSNQLEDYISENEEETDAVHQLTKLMSKMTFFTLRCSYKQVSNVTHQSKLYQVIRDSLNIDDLINELHFELESLSSITEMKQATIDEKNRIKDEQRTKINEEHNQSFHNFLAILTIIFVTISTLGDGFSVLNQLAIQFPIKIGLYPIALIALELLIGGGLIISILVYFHLAKKKKKKLEEI